MNGKDSKNNSIQKTNNKTKFLKEGYESDFSMFKLNQKGERIEIIDHDTANLVKKVLINPQLLNEMSSKKPKPIDS